MSWIWEYALPFAIVLGSVVLFHEFGHYLVAKWFGITVEVFSVGFGPRLWGFERGDTDYRISWVPLGGYVKLKGESPEDGSAPGPGDLLSRPRWQRFLVFVMGAIFNLATAFVLTAAIFMTGVDEPAYLYEPPVVGAIDPKSSARDSGIQPGDRIVTFDDRVVSNWRELETLILLSPRQTKEVVLERGGQRIVARLAIEAGRSDVGHAGILPATGVVVGAVHPGMPAERAGLRPGDQIMSIDGVTIDTFNTLLEIIRNGTGQELRFVLRRGTETFERNITPVLDKDHGVIGFTPALPSVVRSYPFLESIRQSVLSNIEQAGLVFVTFRKLLNRELSLRAFSGPIELYRFSGRAAQEGVIPFLQLIAFISLQLGIINLFPVPPLDGGHLFFLVIEGTIRREIPSWLKERVAQTGLILLLLFMGTIIYFDVTKSIP